MKRNPLECDICCNAFSEALCPRNLPCSHTFCEKCIKKMIIKKDLVCPICRNKFTVGCTEDLMVNRVLLDVIEQLSSTNAGLKSSSSTSNESVTKFTESLIDKSTEKIVSECQEAKTKVLDTIKILSGIKDDFIKCNQKIDEIKLSNERILNNIEQNTTILKNGLDVIEEKVEQIKILEPTTDYTSASSNTDNGKDMIDDALEAVRDHIQEKIMIIKNSESTWMLISLIVNLLLYLALKETREKGSPPKMITVDDLRSLQEPSRENIFVLQVFEGKNRVAPLNFNTEDQVFMSHFQEGALPQNSLVVKHESLMKKYSSRRVFLDLNLDGRFLGRIIIRLKDEGNKAQNFLHMCTGDLGPSYANSKVYGVSTRGSAGEHVQMGQYVKNGYYAWEPVLPGVDWGMEKNRNIYKYTTWEAGDVRGDISFRYASWFWIVTIDDPYRREADSFGYVEEGLDALRSVVLRYASYDTSRIEISDCGLIINL